jgi:protein DJ-1
MLTVKSVLLLISFVSVVRVSLSSSDMTKTALVAIANGTEEMEAVIIIDVLRRAGISVTVAAVNSGHDASAVVKCSRGVVIQADTVLTDSICDFDIVILPGGLDGSKAFAASPVVGHVLKKQEKAGRLIAAICAAPTALKAHGIGSGKRVTSYPGLSDEMKSGPYHYSEDRVVVDGNLITSRGPGTAFEFALAIVKQMLGEEKMTSVQTPLLLK